MPRALLMPWVWVLLFVILTVLGASLRYGFVKSLGPFWGVSLANVGACLVLGFAMESRFFQGSVVSGGLIAVALCGALSTFSSYVQFLFECYVSHQYLKMAGFVLVNHILALFAFLSN